MRAGSFKRHLASAVNPDRFHSTCAARQLGGRTPEAREVAEAAFLLLSSGVTAINGVALIADGASPPAPISALTLKALPLSPPI